MLYNDAYIPLLGAENHPCALGRPAGEVKTAAVAGRPGTRV